MLSSVLADLANQYKWQPDGQALVEGAVSLTFSELFTQVHAVAGYLKTLGIKKGDRVGVLMSKTIEQPVAQLGVLAAGGVLVPISDLLKSGQVQYISQDCAISAVIIDHDKMERLGPAGQNCKMVVTAIDAHDQHPTLHSIVQAGTPRSDFDAQVFGHDNAAIIYSSGSTGMPKGIVLSHRNLWDGAHIVCSYLDLEGSDRIAGIMSFNFDYGLNQIFCMLRVGASLHLHKFHFPKDVFQFIRDSSITTLPLMPVFLNRLFEQRFYKPSFADGIETLRRITTSGGRMPRETLDAMENAFPGTKIFLMYGLTEAFRSTYLEPSQVGIRPGSIGKAIPDVEILVVDENGDVCPPDVPGELIHLGGVIAKGYWNAPEKTAERFRPWPNASGNTQIAVFSGDVVKRDVDGYLYFIGRNDNMIKTSGHRVSPEEIERAAETMPGISDAVAFGREHPVLGEEIVLICALQASEDGADGKNSLDDFAIKTFLREQVASYMVPHVVLMTTDFEVTAGNEGKIDRETAKRMAANQTEAS